MVINFKKLTTVGLFLLILSLTSCAPAGLTEHEYGFFGGVWHGFIITFSLIGYLFFDIGLFAETNSGLAYYIGCILGMLIIGLISRGRL